MKKYIITLSVALLASVSLVSAQVGVQNFAFSKDLSVGATGSEVSNLQTWLIANGYDIPALSSMLAVKGYFGAQTKVALMKYQNENGIPNTGYFGPITRERFNRGNSINAPVKVISPNGNELWPINSVQTIRWNTASYSDNSNITIRIQKNISGCFNSSPNSACLAVMDPEYTIATDVANTGSYSWKVGTYSQVAYGGSMNLDDNYIVMICKGSNKAVGSCDSSDNMFSITSDVVDSRAPVINGIDAPTTLSVNQTGTWAVRSTDPQNGTLSYSVDWGDVSYPHITCPVGYTCQPSAPAASIQQGSTFTHAYTTAGTFTVTFTVKNNTGITTRSTVTVHVSQSGANPISIISPNGGEIWQSNSVHQIAWTVRNSSDANSPYDLYLDRVNVNCIAMVGANCDVTYVLDRNIMASSIYNWIVATDINNATIPAGDYKVRICKSGLTSTTATTVTTATLANCDSSDFYFTIK